MVDHRADVIVVGAGIAGLTCATALARAGATVTCIDPEPAPRSKVGESLDWSAGPLLERFGLSTGDLVDQDVATYKREVRVHTPDGRAMTLRPHRRLSSRPFRFPPVALHLARGRADAALLDAAVHAGVRVLEDAVTAVSVIDGRVASVSTKCGNRLRARWYVDASGGARVIGRAVGSRRVHTSSRRVAVWSYTNAHLEFEGTGLHLVDDGPLAWAWEIPVSPDVLSVGVVMPLERFRSRRTEDGSVDELFRSALGEFAGTRHFEDAEWSDVFVRTYRSFQSEQMYGPNWVLIGEAGCFVDPLTSTGVSSALRHGFETADALATALHRPVEGRRRLRRYERRSNGMARLYGDGAERLLYGPTIRGVFGPRVAAVAYVVLGFFATALYGKTRPETSLGTLVVKSMFAAFRMWTGCWVAFARVIGFVRRTPPRVEAPVY